jgi:Heme NO binding.
MKGTVVATWLRTCRKIYDKSVVEKAMSSVGWKSSRIFSPADNVDDNEVRNVIEYIAKAQGIPVNELWRKIGQDNINSFFNVFSSIFST